MVCRVPEKLLQRSRSDFLRRHQSYTLLKCLLKVFRFILNLSFFEIAHPILLGDPDSILQQVEETGSVRAPCVARLVVSAEQMKRMVAAMAEGYENYEENLKEQQASTSRRRKNAS